MAVSGSIPSPYVATESIPSSILLAGGTVTDCFQTAAASADNHIETVSLFVFYHAMPSSVQKATTPIPTKAEKTAPLVVYGIAWLNNEAGLPSPMTDKTANPALPK